MGRAGGAGADAPGNLSKGSTASFTATWPSLGSSVNPISGSVLPAMSSDAYLTMGCPTAFATKGTVRDARGLASMMYTCSKPRQPTGGPHQCACIILTLQTTGRTRRAPG